MNFYQLDVWKQINENIYKKPVFELDFFWKKYWWIIKEHKKFWISFRWAQVLWIKIPENTELSQLKEEFFKVRKKFDKFWDIFFQFWIINVLKEPFYENRKKIESELNKEGLYPSIKENMPLATVVCDLTKSEEEIYRWFSKTAKRYVNKARKSGCYFEIVSSKDINKFYDIWYEVAKLKWFHIYDKQTYLDLIFFLKSTKKWDLFLLKKDNEIVSGSIFIFDNKNSYYLYGATNRKFDKLPGHYLLKYEIFKWLKGNWFEKVDLLGVSPMWYENHHLKWVTQFKHSLGWSHIEYWWNYDLPLNRALYSLLRSKKYLTKNK